MDRTAIFWCIEKAVEMGGADVANAASSAFANAMLSVKKRFSLFANSLRVLQRCLRRFAFLMCFSCAVDTVSNMLNFRFVGTDVEAAMGEIVVGGVGSLLSVRSENLFEEVCIACDDFGDNVDVSVRPEGGMMVHTVSRMAVV